MSIDQVNFDRLKSYKASKYQSFEMLWFLLCTEEYKGKGKFTPVDDSGGGDGVEFYLTLENGDIWGWQCKFFDRLNKGGRKKQINTSLEQACKKHGDSLKKWILCTLSDFTPEEQNWFATELNGIIPEECADLELIHNGDSVLNTLLAEYPHVANFFFDENRISDDWIAKHLNQVFNRPEIQEKYIPVVHTSGQEEERILLTLGGKIMANQLVKRLGETTIEDCAEKFKKSVTALQELTCDGEIEVIKKSVLRILEGKEDIINGLLCLYHKLIDALKNDSVKNFPFDISDKICSLYKSLYKCLCELSEFKRPEKLGSIHWDSESSCANRQEIAQIQKLRETILGPYFVLDDYSSPLYGVFGELDALHQKEFHIRGNASKGKSHLVLNLVDQYRQQGLPAIYLSGRDFIDSSNPLIQLNNLLGLPSDIPLEEVFSQLDLNGRLHGVKSLLVIDGLNESLNWANIWETGISRIRSIVNGGNYPNVTLITTCRTSYLDEIFGDSINHDYRLLITVNGFDFDNFEEALGKYLAFYEVHLSNHADTYRLFSENPLALRIFCKTHQGQNVSLSQMTIFDVFENYIKVCNGRVVKLLGERPHLNRYFLADKLSYIGGVMWDNNTNGITIEQANLTKNELHAIEAEDLILYREWRHHEEILFTYDLLAGYFIAKHILKDYSDKEKFLQDFDTVILPRLLAGNGGKRHPLFDDILSCLLVIATESFGFIFAHYNDEPLVWNILRSVYSLRIDCIKQNIEPIKDWVSKHLVTSRSLFQISEPYWFTDNPLNFSFVSTLLKSLELTDRDILWTADRMNLFSGLSEMEKEIDSSILWVKSNAKLYPGYPEYLMWLLTTNCHTLRFKATKALYYWGRTNPREFADLLQFSFGINDIYVPERMLAVAYGITLFYVGANKIESHADWLISVARAVYNAIFSELATFNTTHYFVREYSRRLILLVNRIFPGIFSTNEIALLYKKGSITKETISSWEKVTDWVEPMRMDFSNYTLGSLIPGGHSYQNPDLKQKVRGYINRRVRELGWSEEKFKEIDSNIHRRSDYSRHNDSSKIDRFGKKYLWIAYYEIAGILDDTDLLDREWHDWRALWNDIDPTFPEESQYDHIEIDNFLGNGLSMEEWRNAENDLPLADLFIRKFDSNSEIPYVCLYGYNTAKDEALDRDRFVFIRPLIYHKEDEDRFISYLYAEDISRHWLMDPKENMECFAGEMGVWKDSTESNWGSMSFVMNGSDLKCKYDRMMEIMQAYLDGESEFDPKDEMNSLIEEIHSERVEFNIFLPTMVYLAEFDCAIGSQMTLSKEIIFSEGLRMPPQYFNLVDKNNELAFFNFYGKREHEDGQHFSYIRKDVLDSFLERNNLSMVWLVWGEKDHVKAPSYSDPTHYQTIELYDDYSNLQSENEA